MLRADRYLHFFTACDDRPGSLASMLKIVAEERGKVLSITHDRLRPTVALGMTGVELLVEVRDKAHQQRILAAHVQANYPIDTAD